MNQKIMADTADKIDPVGGNYNNTTGHSVKYGFGRLNADRAVRTAIDLGGAPRPRTPQTIRRPDAPDIWPENLTDVLRLQQLQAQVVLELIHERASGSVRPSSLDREATGPLTRENCLELTQQMLGDLQNLEPESVEEDLELRSPPLNFNDIQVRGLAGQITNIYFKRWRTIVTRAQAEACKTVKNLVDTTLAGTPK